MDRVLMAGCVGLIVACALVIGLATEAGARIGEVPPAVLQQTAATVLDGVFTSAQARRGRRVYRDNCGYCHGAELKGGEMGPGIAGADFWVSWTEQPIGSLFEWIKVTMPEDGPARLSDKEYTDVVAFMLDANSYPAGEVELPVDKAAMDEIMVVAVE
jgi:cytochrome c